MLDLSLDFLGKQDIVDEFGLQIIVGLGKKHDAVVGQLVQVFCLHLTALADLFQPVVPDAVEIG